MTEPEVCSHCGQPKPIALILRSKEGDTLLCQLCATRWLLSDEEWPPTKGKTSIQTKSKISV